MIENLGGTSIFAPSTTLSVRCANRHCAGAFPVHTLAHPVGGES
ncbi:Unknown protein sequence [Pseudomonas amygdali pv. lachrymans]|nr:Unknown protein sequence [Pseudomonas amygdali pv. lachrymans]